MNPALHLPLLLAGLCACAPPHTRQPSWQDRVPMPPLTRQPAPADLGQQAFAHVEKLVAMGPRHAGTKGWQKSVDYIAAELARLGLAVQRDRWTEPDERVEFENLVATLPGSSRDRILIACHHDTKRCTGHADAARNFEFVGANDSGSGVGLLLALAAVLRTRQHAATYELAFFDGEESQTWEWEGGKRALFGSRRYVAEMQRKEQEASSEGPVRALVLLDMVGAKSLQIDDDSNSDQELKQVFAAAAKACGHERYFFVHKQTVSDDHLPFVDAGIRAIDLIDIADNPEWHTKDDVLERMSAASLQIVGEVVLTALPELERRHVRLPVQLPRPESRR